MGKTRLRKLGLLIELAAWVMGDVLQRIDAAESAGDPRLNAVYVYHSLLDAIDEHEEG